VKAKRNDWWLDKAFGRIGIASAARIGENVVTIKASPFTMYHELEPAYVLGDFALKAADKGFVIARRRRWCWASPASQSALPLARVGTSKVILSIARAFPTGRAST
jgi:hypothetical protein